MKKQYKIFLIILTFIAVLVFGACTPYSQSSSDGDDINAIPRKTVYTSFYPIFDFTSKIAGEKMNIELIIPAGAEPHDFDISLKTYAELEKADLIIINGLGIESFGDQITDTIPSAKLVILDQYTDPLVFSGIDDGHGHDDREEEDTEESDRIKYDPHVWLDPMRALTMSEAIYESLSKIDPDNQSYYEQNYEQLAAKLKDLDKDFSELTDIENKKQIIVSHNAFSYLAKRYNLTFTSIFGVSVGQESSSKDIARIIDLINTDEINTIFLTELSNTESVYGITSDTDASVDVLYTIEGMTPSEIENGEDYFYKMNLNLEKIKNAIK